MFIEEQRPYMPLWRYHSPAANITNATSFPSEARKMRSALRMCCSTVFKEMFKKDRAVF